MGNRDDTRKKSGGGEIEYCDKMFTKRVHSQQPSSVAKRSKMEHEDIGEIPEDLPILDGQDVANFFQSLDSQEILMITDDYDNNNINNDGPQEVQVLNPVIHNDPQEVQVINPTTNDGGINNDDSDISPQILEAVGLMIKNERSNGELAYASDMAGQQDDSNDDVKVHGAYYETFDMPEYLSSDKFLTLRNFTIDGSNYDKIFVYRQQLYRFLEKAQENFKHHSHVQAAKRSEIRRLREIADHVAELEEKIEELTRTIDFYRLFVTLKSCPPY